MKYSERQFWGKEIVIVSRPTSKKVTEVTIGGKVVKLGATPNINKEPKS